MSSRALRRLQKNKLDEVSVDSEEEEEEVVESKPVKQINPFDLLNEGDDDDDEEEEEEEEEDVEKVERKEEAKIEEEEEEEEEEEKPVANTSKKNKKKNKKNKKKGSNDNASKKDTEDMSMKELDKVLKEMNQKSGKKSNNNNKNGNSESQKQLLSINYRNLDAEAEMKRLFGSHVVNSENRATQGRILKKSKFSTPKSDWAPYKRNGLSMEVVETKDGVTHYAFKHSEQYMKAELDFVMVVGTHSPEQLVLVHRKHPYHINTLLQLSEVAKHSGDWTSAGDFIEKALYACERAFHPNFSLSSGTARLSFKRAENRSFFIAIFRHIQFLIRRGCWKTALEFNKVLFSLDPESDPLGGLLSLDYHALTARDFDYIVKMNSEWRTDGNVYPTHLSNLPSFAYSTAFAQFKISDKKKESLDKADQTLQEAIKKFPLVYCRILEKLGEAEVKQATQLIQMMPNPYMDFVQQQYVERTHELWKEPEVLEWFKKNGNLIMDYPVEHPEVIQQQLLCKMKNTIPQSVCRYIILLDIQRLLSYLPSEVTSRGYQVYDPLPPVDSEAGYDLNAIQQPQQRGSLANNLNDIVGMLQNLLNVGDGALDGEAQAQIRHLMGELEQARNTSAGQIPGAFPGAEDVLFEEHGDGEEEEEEEEYPDLVEHDG
ncbi:DUF654-domain-containing protein [Backusella circina FSU 941]|nr:DUF654-domain-containing protein [Backusella circina FSU 941]